MKTKVVASLFVLLVPLVSIQTLGQGTILFNTRIVGQVDAPVTVEGINGVGTLPDNHAQLFLIAGGNTYVPLFPATTFRDGSQNPIAARYVVQPATSVVVPGVQAGSQATVVLRAWIGPNYDSATLRGQSGPVTIALGGLPFDGGAPIPDGVLLGLQGFSLIWPEPSTMSLAMLGAAALLFWRKRQR